MHPELTHLHHIAELDRLLAESAERPLLLFKHSDSCGTSAEALDEILSHLDQPSPDDASRGRAAAGTTNGARFAMVTVQSDRAVSDAVTTRLGVRHETPQALLVRNGRVVWSASHFRVTADAIARAIAVEATHADDQAH
jgi:bacillithiol system protein YtxJ